MEKLVLIAGLVAILAFSGCTQPPGGVLPPAEIAKADCIAQCQANNEAGADLSSGPCLSDNNPNWQVSGWVCDVAHSPREAVDDLPENQCSEFRSGVASHFVEVNPGCEFIREV